MNARELVPDKVVRKFLKEYERSVLQGRATASGKRVLDNGGRISKAQDRLIRRYQRDLLGKEL